MFYAYNVFMQKVLQTSKQVNKYAMRFVCLRNKMKAVTCDNITCNCLYSILVNRNTAKVLIDLWRQYNMAGLQNILRIYESYMQIDNEMFYDLHNII